MWSMHRESPSGLNLGKVLISPRWQLQIGKMSLRTRWGGLRSWRQECKWKDGMSSVVCVTAPLSCVYSWGSFEAVLRLPVPAQVHLPLEAFSAQIAAKGLEARVLAAVSDEVGALAESLAAHLALVRLLASVDEGVFLHIRLLMEPLATVLTGVGPGV